MYVTEQRMNDIYRNINEVVGYLDNVNKGQDAAYSTLLALECLENVKNNVSFMGISIAEKSDRICILENGIKQLEFDFED